MKSGNLVILGIMGCVVVGGLWMRSVAMTQWGLTQDFYKQQQATLKQIDTLHAEVRDLKLHPDQRPLQVAAEAKAMADAIAKLHVPNGRTSRTQDAEVTYVSEAAQWAKDLARTHQEAPQASPSFLDLEIAYGALVGQVQLSDRAYTFKVPAAPGTMPTPTPKRVI